jgi:hypothetical protein
MKPVGLLALLAAFLFPAIFLQAATVNTSVDAMAMPWIWNTTTMNSGFQFGIQDGIGPDVINSSSGISFASGGTLHVTYVLGRTTAFGGDPPEVDANGYGPPPSPFEYDANDNLGSSGTDFPSFYMAPYPIYLNELVGAFTDAAGTIVGNPFAIGNGPFSITIPNGASQLQMGINDDIFFDNSGSLAVTVDGPDASVVPEPGTLILISIPLIALGFWKKHPRKQRH